MTQLQFAFDVELPTATPDYEAIASEIGQLLNVKQKAYGNSFGELEKIINVLYPTGIVPAQYKNLLTLTRILDKVFRIANLPEDGQDIMNEDPWKDIAGYSILALSNVNKYQK